MLEDREEQPRKLEGKMEQPLELQDLEDKAKQLLQLEDREEQPLELEGRMEQPLELQDLEDKAEQLLQLEDREENFPQLGKVGPATGYGNPPTGSAPVAGG